MKPSGKISKNKMNSAPPVRLSVFIYILRNLVEYLILIGLLERTVAMETVDPRLWRT